MKMLSATERRMMHIIWRKGCCSAKCIIRQLPAPGPGYYSTLLSLRRLKRFGYIDYRVKNWRVEYFPLVERQERVRSYLRTLMAETFKFTPEFLEECLSGKHLLKPIDNK